MALRGRGVKVSRWRVVGRLFRIAFHLATFYLPWLWHRLVVRNVEQREKLDAQRFREALERLHGVFIKIGQQLSQRPDVLPPAYCNELKNFLEDVGKDLSRRDIEAAIKRQTGKSVAETFRDFVWKPKGSASVACVYKAWLFTGEEVAVKIRRPRIKKSFSADLKAVDWIFQLVEFLTIWRAGTTTNIRKELREVLFEELDFILEARYQELFRRYHKRRRKIKVTAPKVFYEYSGEEVLVSEFVTGRKMSELLEYLELGDPDYLAKLEADDIDPKKLAKQLIRSRYYSFHECPMFHGDPHPANIIVQPHNQIVMIDFGACGVFSQRDRNLMWQLNSYYAREDVAGMVNMVIHIMEPINPVRGVFDFRKELRDAWWEGFYGIKSRHAEWWERSSVFLWLKYFELIRKHQIPIPRNLVRMIRATLLYDTVAARLDHKINVFREFQKYRLDVAKRVRRDIEKCAVRQLLLGPDDANFLKLQQITDVGNGLLDRVQRYLDDPEISLSYVAGKVYSAFRALVRMMLLGGATALVAGVVAIIFKFSSTSKSVWTQVTNATDALPGNNNFLKTVFSLWLLSALGLLVAYGRRIYLRFGDVDE
jgi:ubiquinone biosynthesis protein